MSEPPTYRFGPLEKRGLLGPLRAGQATMIAAGALMAVVVLDSSPSAGGAVLATGLFVVSSGLAIVRVAGQAFDEWSPVVVSFGWRKVRARTRFSSLAPAAGFHLPLARGQAAAQSNRPDPPPGLHDVRILQAEHRGRAMGIVSSRGGRQLVAILACRAAAFALLDSDAQRRRLARWGHVLAGAASSPLSRLQWVERTAPAQGDELARWLHSERDRATALRGTPMVDSYLELIGTSAEVAHEHEILLAVQVDARRVRERGQDAAVRALVEQADRIAQGLEAAEVGVLGALGPGQIARALRTAFDPYARGELTPLEAVESGRARLPESSAWPLGAAERWENYQCDGACHATYWIGGWPRIDVTSMFMDALLGRSSCVRTVAVVFEPVAPDRSTREAEAAVTRDQADRELRRRFGQSHTARQRQAEEAALRRELELAAGHAEVRFAGFVTVSGRDEQELRAACTQVTEQAARARLELHRMYGQQAAAFTFTLPLCRGLR